MRGIPHSTVIAKQSHTLAAANANCTALSLARSYLSLSVKVGQARTRRAETTALTPPSVLGCVHRTLRRATCIEEGGSESRQCGDNANGRA